MSTILDALKKSEQERKLNDLPTLADMPAPQEQSRWPQITIIILLGLLLLVLAVWLAREVLFDTNSEPQAANNIVLNNETIEATGRGDTTAESGIKINVVSYSETPEQRFAMINGKMARENEFVRAGLKVIEIKPNSVVMIERGRRFELSP